VTTDAFEEAAERMARIIRAQVEDPHEGALVLRRAVVIIESGWIPRRRSITYHDRHGQHEEALRTRMRRPEGSGPEIAGPGSPRSDADEGA